MAGGARILSVRPTTNGLVLVTDRVNYPPPARSVVEALKPLVILKGVVERQPAIRTTLSSGKFQLLSSKLLGRESKISVDKIKNSFPRIFLLYNDLSLMRVCSEKTRISEKP